jgi:RNA ligase
MSEIGKAYNIPFVKAYAGNGSNIEQLLDGLENAEGFVIRFNNGHMVKAKTSWYVKIHKVKDSINLEKNVIDLIINNKLDDAKPFMIEADLKRVEEFENLFWDGFNEVSIRIEDEIKGYLEKYQGDRKGFALSNTCDKITRTIAFKVWDGLYSVRIELLELIKSNINTSTKLDTIRFLWNNHRWNHE